MFTYLKANPILISAGGHYFSYLHADICFIFSQFIIRTVNITTKKKSFETFSFKLLLY